MHLIKISSQIIRENLLLSAEPSMFNATRKATFFIILTGKRIKVFLRSTTELGFRFLCVPHHSFADR